MKVFEFNHYETAEFNAAKTRAPENFLSSKLAVAALSFFLKFIYKLLYSGEKVVSAGCGSNFASQRCLSNFLTSGKVIHTRSRSSINVVGIVSSLVLIMFLDIRWLIE